jgi:hypothetical protein
MNELPGLDEKLEFLKKRYSRFIEGYEKNFQRKFYETYIFLIGLNPNNIELEIKPSKSLFFNVTKKEMTFQLEVFYDDNLIESICTIYKKNNMIYRNTGNISDVFFDIQTKVK